MSGSGQESRNSGAAAKIRYMLSGFIGDPPGSKLAGTSNYEFTHEAGASGNTVEFSSSIYYCEEGDGSVELEVVRRGRLELPCSVEYATSDQAAAAGKKYTASSGRLMFQPGETSKILRIDILDDASFDTTLDFEVYLSRPQHTDLGHYLGRCRVLIVDNDAFPTNKYRSQLLSQRVSEVPHWPLMFEFWRMNLADKHFRRCCMKTVIGDQISNLNFVLATMLFNYLIDHVLRPADGSPPPDHAGEMVWAIVGVSVVPHAILWLLDRWAMMRRVKGQVVTRCQANLLRKFLNYDEASRNVASTSDLTMAISRDVPELAESGIVTCFVIAKKVGLLLVLSILAIRQMTSAGIIAIGIFLGAPVSMVAFLYCRHKGTAERRKSAFRRQTELVGYLQQTIDCYRLICDYSQGPTVVNSFGDKIKACNDASLASALWELTNQHFAPLMQTVICGSFIVLTYQDVLNGSPLGEFVTGVALCNKIGQCYVDMYREVLRISQALAPLHNIVFYMNLPIDVPQRMKNSRALIKEARRLRTTASTVCASTKDTVRSHDAIDPSRDVRLAATSAEDSMHIRGKGVTFSYPSFSGGGTCVLRCADFTIPQGKLVAVTGPRLGGKATLLHLLGRVLPPSSETFQGTVEGEESSYIFIPPHLRVLHVSFNPQLICNLNLFENLCFGPSDGPDEDPARVMAICKRLRLSDRTLAMVGTNCRNISSESLVQRLYEARQKSVHRGESAGGAVDLLGTPESVANRHLQELSTNEEALMSHTDRSVLHLARALVMNPDVLVLHKPLAHFDDLQAAVVLEVLRDFVDNRGIEKPPETRDLRHPRTCIFSTTTTTCTDAADQVLHVGGGTVREVDNAALVELRQNVRDLFNRLTDNGTSPVTQQAFLDGFKGAPWAWVLLGITNKHLEAGHDVEALLLRCFQALDRLATGVVDSEVLQSFLTSGLDMKILESVACQTAAKVKGPVGWEVPPVPFEASLLSGTGADEVVLGNATLDFPSQDLSHTISQSPSGLPSVSSV